jgi:hypothetical protein
MATGLKKTQEIVTDCGDFHTCFLKKYWN